MTERGLGEKQIKMSRKAKQKIIQVLQDRKAHRYQQLQEETGLSTATLSKHLKELESGLVKRTVNVEEGFYPPPVYYEINLKPFDKRLSWADKIGSNTFMDKRSGWITKHKELENYIREINWNVGQLLIYFLRIYFENPLENEEKFNQALEYYLIPFFQDYVQNAKLKMEELADKGENIKQILDTSEKKLSSDIGTILKRVKKERKSKKRDDNIG
jgi:DNA-binding transcriptional ArsR family regulator